MRFRSEEQLNSYRFFSFAFFNAGFYCYTHNDPGART